MATFETRPFLSASPGAVAIEVYAIDPEVELQELHRVWRPGQAIRLVVTANLLPRFWIETAVPPSSEITLVCRLTCHTSRRQWTRQVPFEQQTESWIATAEISPDPRDINTELQFEVFVVGPGVCDPLASEAITHAGAKVWEWQRNPFPIPLEDFHGLFPTSVISFSQEGWPRQAWRVVVSTECALEWSVPSSVRVYINADVLEATQLDQPQPVAGITESIEVDIVFAVMRHLDEIKGLFDVKAIDEIALNNSRSFAALVKHLAARIGKPPTEAARLAVESPQELIERARIAAQLFTRPERQS